jgi:aryl-alcohol dehydrogenase-like predicted oxidoreductase
VIARCLFDHSGALAGGKTEEELAKNDVKLSNSSVEIRTEYLNRIERLKADASAAGLSLATLGIRFALSRPGLSNVAISLANTQQLDEAISAANQGPLPEEWFQRVRRDHVWVKNFYYFSKATVDGNKPS